jgi:hypothetical protein
MEKFTESMPFLLFFLIGTLAFHLMFGTKMTERFLSLVLVSMIVMNSEKVKDLLGKVKYQ